MPDQTITMDAAEWQQMLFVLANAQGQGITWAVTNPLLMKLGEQLQKQQPGQNIQARPNGPDLNPPANWPEADVLEPGPTPPPTRRVPRG